MQTTSLLPPHKRSCVLLACSTLWPQADKVEDEGAVRYHFPLTREALQELHKQALALGTTEELLHHAEAFYDSSENALLRASPGGWWLRWREVEGKEEEGYWVLRM